MSEKFPIEYVTELINTAQKLANSTGEPFCLTTEGWVQSQKLIREQNRTAKILETCNPIIKRYN